MHLDALKYFYDKTLNQNPTFLYRGTFEEYFTNIILDMAGTSKGSINQNKSKQKVSFMLVECFQNLIKHAETVQNEEYHKVDNGMFGFKNMPHAFVINSINLINNDEVENLERLVNEVNSLASEDLKRLYLSKLENGRLSSKGGAGLGLIELARKSGQKILFQTRQIDENISQFHQQVALLDPSCMAEKNTYQKEIEINNELYSSMEDFGVHLVFKGDVSNQSLLPILDFLKTYLEKESTLSRHIARGAHVLIELSQNITKHGAAGVYGNVGLLVLGEKNGKTVISAGNLIGLSEKIILEQKLSFLSMLEHQELTELHKRSMEASLRFENKRNSGLGLIEITKAAREPLSYYFFQIDEDCYLFALSVTV